MHTYRRLASTASSTSRSASNSMSHAHTHPTNGMSRSSSTTTSTATESRGLTITMPASGIARGLASASSASTTRSPSTPYGTLSSSNLNLSPPEYTSSDLHTIAESLLAHVTFGPYHIASSPVPSSHMHTLLAASQSSRNKENTGAPLGGAGGASTTSISSSTTSILGPSTRRQFEGKEGSHSHHRGSTLATSVVTYPPIPPLTPFGTSTPRSNANNGQRARFTIGPEERGRGARRESVGEGMRGRGLARRTAVPREVSSTGWEEERGREGVRGRRGDVKVLNQ